MRGALALALVALLAQVALAARSFTVPANLVAQVSAADEVPPVASSAVGLVVMTYDPATMRLYYKLLTNITTAITGFHIHLTAMNTTKYLLSVSGSGVTDPLPMSWVVPILMQQTYINVHSAAFTGGEVRGNLIVAQPGQQLFSVVALPTLVTDISKAGPPSALGLAILTLSSGTATGNLLFSPGAGIASVSLVAGVLGIDGATLCSGLAYAFSCGGLDANMAATGQYHLDFLSASGAPLIRGQIFPVNSLVGPNAATLAAPLPNIAGTLAYGMFLGGFDPLTSTLAYQLWHNATAVTSVTLNAVTLCSSAVACASPLIATTPTLAVADIQALFSSAAVLTLSTAAFPAGELRSVLPYGQTTEGSLTPVRKYTAVVSCSQEVPPALPATAAIGAAVIWIDSASMLHYNIWYSALGGGAVTKVHIHFSNSIGQMGSIASVAPSPLVLLVSDVASIGSYDVSAIANFSVVGGDVLNGRAYVNIHTVNYTAAGEARGQILAVDPQAPLPATHTVRLAPVSGFGAGLGAISYDQNSRGAAFSFIWEGVTGTANLSLATAAGATVATLGGSASGRLAGTIAPLSLANAALLASSQLVVNLLFADGLLSGTAAYSPADIVAVASASQEVNATHVIVSAQSAVTAVTFNAAGTAASYASYTSFADGALAFEHYHFGVGPGLNAAGPFVLCAAAACDGAVINPAKAMTMPVAANARVGLAYLNVHSVVNPAGEIRGQMAPLVPLVAPQTPAAVVSWAIDLLGAASVPASGSSASGLAVLTFADTALSLSLSVASSVAAPTTVIVGLASSGASGTVLASVAAAAGGAVTTLSLTIAAADLCALKGGRVYVAVASAAFPSGEIRGQIGPSAYTHATPSLSGAQETPPVTSARMGLGAFGTAAFAVFHNLGLDATLAHTHLGAVGTAGGVQVSLSTIAGSAASPIRGAPPALTAQQTSDLAAGLWYINVHSLAVSSGELRGQLATVSNPTACPVAASPPPPPPPASSAARGAAKKKDKYFTQTNGIYAAIVVGGLLVCAIIAVVVVKAVKKPKKTGNYSYGAGSSALMQL